MVEPPLKQQLTFLLRPPRLSRDDRPPPPLAVARTRLIMRRVRSPGSAPASALYVVVSIIRLSALGRVAVVLLNSDRTSGESAPLVRGPALLSRRCCCCPSASSPPPSTSSSSTLVGNAHLLVVQEAVQALHRAGLRAQFSLLGADGEEMRERERTGEGAGEDAAGGGTAATRCPPCRRRAATDGVDDGGGRGGQQTSTTT